MYFAGFVWWGRRLLSGLLLGGGDVGLLCTTSGFGILLSSR